MKKAKMEFAVLAQDIAHVQNFKLAPDRIAGDDEAIARCQQGDREAFGYLVQKYMRQAYYVALGLTGSHASALDLSQEAFIRAYRAIVKFDRTKVFFTWYYRILQNLCFNDKRNRSRHAIPFSEMDLDDVHKLPDQSNDTEVIAEQNERKRAVWRAIESLAEKEREIIVLRDFQNLSYKEIAELLEIPEGTVMSRLYRARQMLRVKLEGVL